MARLKILYLASELFPLVKTGGLADVAASLPAALKKARHDVRILLPAYRCVLRQLSRPKFLGCLDLDTPTSVRILETTLPHTRVKVWLVDSPSHFDRDGGPYLDDTGQEWPDNAERFTVFAKAAEQLISTDRITTWSPQIVHCNDWQSGLLPALLSTTENRPKILFTIHNLAYQGNFPATTFGFLAERYAIPQTLWGIHGVEFYGRFSFMKSGLQFADWINTVSPTYAREILTPEFAHGMEGLLRHRIDRLSGILNGIDYELWNPESDPYLDTHYSAQTLEHKQRNKSALQRQLNLDEQDRLALIGTIGRLVEQKGIDLIIDILPWLMSQPVQLVILGSGLNQFESRLQQWQSRFPRRLSVNFGYDEALAHRIEAAADMFLMPSRFEPCGLNQMYSLHYGTPPIVRHTGGLADTVVDSHTATLADGTANGFVFEPPHAEALQHAVGRALAMYHDQPAWRQIAQRGMTTDFSWEKSAQEYIRLYHQLLTL